jgi:ABC-type Fe3+/spermidine/putrescine transport system ATPase subunit
VGDNGAGKSTLIKCLTGIEHPTSGTVRFRGQPVSLHSPDNARSLGIETVYQDLALVDDLTVWQNLFLNREIYRGIGPLRLLNKRAMVAAAQRTIEDLQVSVPSALAGEVGGHLRGRLPAGRVPRPLMPAYRAHDDAGFRPDMGCVLPAPRAGRWSGRSTLSCLRVNRGRTCRLVLPFCRWL